jgi:hypothetical protein
MKTVYNNLGIKKIIRLFTSFRVFFMFLLHMVAEIGTKMNVIGQLVLLKAG